MNRMTCRFTVSICLILILMPNLLSNLLSGQGDSALDKRVKAFLKENRERWYRMNVPESDGKVLYDLIIKHKYKKALEIGTSTGHSAIWIAWALSKTGGKLITIEIDEPTYKAALENFKKAGLSDYIDARLADAHDLVPKLKGPFDFVFSDADKDWYKKYFVALESKLLPGGCFTAHNVNMRAWGMREFLKYIKNHKDFKTTIVDSSWSGISVSYKKE